MSLWDVLQTVHEHGEHPGDLVGVWIAWKAVERAWKLISGRVRVRVKIELEPKSKEDPP